MDKKFVKLFTQSFPYYLASFIFFLFVPPCICDNFLFLFFLFAVLNTFKTKKKCFSSAKFFSLLVFLGYPTCIFFTENVTIASSVKLSTTYQILCTSVKYFLSYSANRQTDGNERPYFSESTWSET